jgi:nucleoside-triphosphatase
MTPLAHPLRILLTGPPGCGKTTAILRTLDLLSHPAAGFYTEEVRGGKAGGRVGFDVVALDGRRGPLARVGFPGPRVGNYGVDLESFEDVGVRAIERGLRDPSTLLVIDELAKMEFLSAEFVTLLMQVFQSPYHLLGTVLYRPHPLADRFRDAPGVETIQVTRQNRDGLPVELAGRLSEAVAPRHVSALSAAVPRGEPPSPSSRPDTSR